MKHFLKQVLLPRTLSLLKNHILTARAAHLLLFFIAVYALGATAGFTVKHFYLDGEGSDGALPVSAEGNWGLSFQEEGKPPVGERHLHRTGAVQCILCGRYR